LGLDNWPRYWIAGALLFIAVPFGFWAIHTLSLRQSFGLRETLITIGPYKYSRNPQYVSYILIVVGIILITNSLLALSYLILVGMALFGEGLKLHIPKRYIYFTMAFSIAVEMLNLRTGAKRTQPVKLRKWLQEEWV